ncbi:hypothetical protein ACFLW0_07285 [Chloroflexota bacterium]
MGEQELTVGEGRTRVILSSKSFGDDITVFIYNENAHIGAVAVGEFDHSEKRASTSVITRLGHKDDAIAQKAAHSISRKMKKPSCVIAGIHLDDITEQEIQELLKNADSLVEDFLRQWEQHQL